MNIKRKISGLKGIERALSAEYAEMEASLKSLERADDAAEKVFDEYLDDSLPPVEIMGLRYLPSRTLQAVDATAYRCAYADWSSEREDDIAAEMELLASKREEIHAEILELSKKIKGEK